MNRRTFTMKALPALGLALALALPAALAAEPKEKEKEKDTKERKVVAYRVVDDGNGDVKVLPFDGKPVPRGYLGVGLTELTPELRTHFGAPEGAGVMVSKVEPGSPAEKAGIRVGDILTSIDGESIESGFEVRMKVRKAEEGAQVPIELWRDGKAQTLNVALEMRERPELDLAPMFFKKADGNRLMLLGDGDLGEKRIELPLDEILEKAGPGGPGMRVLRLNAREAELEKQLKELEKRIAELEKQLEKR
jgi:membrane-associated protease RseP (regulator of RpoE activity)